MVSLSLSSLTEQATGFIWKPGERTTRGTATHRRQVIRRVLHGQPLGASWGQSGAEWRPSGSLVGGRRRALAWPRAAGSSWLPHASTVAAHHRFGASATVPTAWPPREGATAAGARVLATRVSPNPQPGDDGRAPCFEICVGRGGRIQGAEDGRSRRQSQERQVAPTRRKGRFDAARPV